MAIGVLVIVAVLAIRTAVAEGRSKGSGLKHWSFLGNRWAATAGAFAFVGMTIAVVVSGADWGNVAWALLAGLLSAFIIDQLTKQQP